MTAHQILLPRVIPLAVTVEVKHPQRVGRAFGVPLYDGMPAVTVRTVQQNTNSQWAIHPPRIAKPRDNRGHTRLTQAAHGSTSVLQARRFLPRFVNPLGCFRFRELLGELFTGFTGESFEVRALRSRHWLIAGFHSSGSRWSPGSPSEVFGCTSEEPTPITAIGAGSFRK